jgi:hypothetical protein
MLLVAVFLKSIIMEDLLKLMDEFEKRNNTSISLDLCSDGSGTLKEFWDGDEIKSFENSSELFSFLEKGKLKMLDGRSVNPIEIVAQ